MQTKVTDTLFEITDKYEKIVVDVQNIRSKLDRLDTVFLELPDLVSQIMRKELARGREEPSPELPQQISLKKTLVNEQKIKEPSCSHDVKGQN